MVAASIVPRSTCIVDYRETYGYREGDLPNAEYIGARTFSIPLSAAVTDEDAAEVGLGLTGKSPIYWSALVYDLVMKILYGGYYHHEQEEVAKLIPSGASVVDVCCGTARLYRDFLQEKRCQYLGLDFNGHFVMAVRKHGINVKLFNLLTEDVPEADYVENPRWLS